MIPVSGIGFHLSEAPELDRGPKRQPMTGHQMAPAVVVTPHAFEIRIIRLATNRSNKQVVGVVDIKAYVKETARFVRYCSSFKRAKLSGTNCYGKISDVSLTKNV